MDDDRASHALALALNRSVADAIQEADASKAASLIVAAVDRFVAQVDAPSIRKEAYRRSAEARISVLFDRQASVKEFEHAWSDMEQLGYSSVEREATCLVYRVKGLNLRNAPREDVQRLTRRLESLLPELERQFGESVARHFVEVLKRSR